MIINLGVVIKSLKGTELDKAYPTPEEIRELPLKEVPSKAGVMIKVPDTSKLPRETAKTALIDCLAYYSPVDRKEVFRVYALASKILECTGDVLEVDDEYKPLVARALDRAIAREGKTPESGTGIFEHWCIAQVFQACGINE